VLRTSKRSKYFYKRYAAVPLVKVLRSSASLSTAVIYLFGVSTPLIQLGWGREEKSSEMPGPRQNL